MKNILLILFVLLSLSVNSQTTQVVYVNVLHGDTAFQVKITNTIALDSVDRMAVDSSIYKYYFYNITGTVKDSVQLNNLTTSQLNNTAGFITPTALSPYSQKSDSNTFIATAYKLKVKTDSLADAVTAYTQNRIDDSMVVTRDLVDTKQATLLSATNIKTVNSGSILGSGDLVVAGAAAFSSITGAYTDNASLVTGFGTKEPTITAGNSTQYWRGDKTMQTLDKTAVGLSNVENTALSTWAGTSNIVTVGTIATGVWSGTTIVDGKIAAALTGKTYNGHTLTAGSSTFTGTAGQTYTFPAVTSTLLPNTTTSGVAATPTASSTVTVTHNLGRVPTTIRIKSISSFTSNAAATPVPFSEGTWNSTGNRCLYMVINGTTTQVSQTSTVFSIIMVTSAGNSISGVIGNVTSTGFDIVFTETGTHTAGNYLWEAQ